MEMPIPKQSTAKLSVYAALASNISSVGIKFIAAAVMGSSAMLS
jgi:divalent metal cation (Fe/Co/Zn/Cd) transporter